MNHFTQADFDFFTVGIAGGQAVAVELRMQIGQTLFNVLITRIQLGALGFQVRLRGGVELAFQFQLASVQTDTFETGVDRADVGFFQ
ncbi:hypothetical protein D3C84_707690 [compost metagenome]